MTSTPVKNVGFGPGGPTAAGTVARSAIDSGFQTVWNNQAGKQADNAGQPEGNRAVKKTPGESLKARDEHRARTEKREPSRNVEERTDIPEEKLEEAAEVLEAAAVQMVQKVADTFGMEPEEVQAVMADLGLEQTDVLSSQGLSSLILVVSGEESPQALLTNEELYDSYRELTEQMRELLQECSETLEVNPEQLTQLSQQIQLTKPEEQGQLTQLTEPEEQAQPTQLTEPEEQGQLTKPAEQTKFTQQEQLTKPEEQTQLTQQAKPVEQQFPAVETVEEVIPAKAVEEPGEPGNNADEKPTEAIEFVLSEEQTTVEQTRNEESAGGNRNQKEDRHEGGREQGLNLFAQNLRAEQFEPQVQQADRAESVWDTDTQNIMRQIMDYMKVNLKADMSTMEMQLHPASLGTLQVQIASKGGVVTANFITQNEAVKAALESQMIQLQERFEEQGVKVEAIEVTVQTHQFEQNLEQGRRGSGQEQEPARRGRTRRINLNDSLPPEGMEEEDALAKDIMIANGNTVDYTA